MGSHASLALSQRDGPVAVDPPGFCVEGVQLGLLCLNMLGSLSKLPRAQHFHDIEVVAVDLPKQ